MDSRQMEENVDECWEALRAEQSGGVVVVVVVGEKTKNKHKIMGVTFDMQMEGPVRNINPSNTLTKVLCVNF